MMVERDYLCRSSVFCLSCSLALLCSALLPFVVPLPSFCSFLFPYLPLFSLSIALRRGASNLLYISLDGFTGCNHVPRIWCYVVS